MSIWCLQFFQKTNKNNSSWGAIELRINFLVCFWKNWRYQKDISTLSYFCKTILHQLMFKKPFNSWIKLFVQKLFKGRKNSMKKTIWKDSICVYLDIGQQNENTCFKKKTLKSGLSLKKKIYFNVYLQKLSAY